MIRQEKRAVFSKPTAGKYRNKKINIDGIIFDSKKESQRYLHLKELEKQGKISDLRTQVAFELAKGVKIAGEGKKRPCVRYIADFVYIKDGQQIVEDVKSAITKKQAVYRLKKHLMKSVHNIDVLES